MTYLETLKQFYNTKMEILDIKVAIEVECLIGTEDVELFEACCSTVKDVYLHFEWADITFVTNVLVQFLDNFGNTKEKIDKLSNFYDYFKAFAEE